MLETFQILTLSILVPGVFPTFPIDLLDYFYRISPRFGLFFLSGTFWPFDVLFCPDLSFLLPLLFTVLLRASFPLSMARRTATSFLRYFNSNLTNSIYFYKVYEEDYFCSISFFSAAISVLILSYVFLNNTSSTMNYSTNEL